MLRLCNASGVDLPKIDDPMTRSPDLSRSAWIRITQSHKL